MIQHISYFLHKLVLAFKPKNIEEVDICVGCMHKHDLFCELWKTPIGNTCDRYMALDDFISSVTAGTDTN